MLPAINDRMIARIAAINSVLCCSELCSGYGSLVAISEFALRALFEGDCTFSCLGLSTCVAAFLPPESIKKLAYTTPLVLARTGIIQVH